MYVLDGGETPRSVSEDFEMLAKSMHVYDAEFTVDDDKLALVDTSIALFHLLLSKVSPLIAPLLFPDCSLVAPRLLSDCTPIAL